MLDAGVAKAYIFYTLLHGFGATRHALHARRHWPPPAVLLRGAGHPGHPSFTRKPDAAEETASGVIALVSGVPTAMQWRAPAKRCLLTLLAMERAMAEGGEDRRAKLE